MNPIPVVKAPSKPAAFASPISSKIKLRSTVFTSTNEEVSSEVGAKEVVERDGKGSGGKR